MKLEPEDKIKNLEREKSTLTPKPSDLVKMNIKKRKRFIQKQLESFLNYDFIEDNQCYIDY